MKTTLFVLATLFSTLGFAQSEAFYGNYYLVEDNPDLGPSLRQNCWTMELDEVILGAAGYEEYTVELVFNGFHTTTFMGSVLESTDEYLKIEVSDPDMEEAEIYIYELRILPHRQYSLTCERTFESYLLVSAADREIFPYLECDEEVIIDTEEE